MTFALGILFDLLRLVVSVSFLGLALFLGLGACLFPGSGRLIIPVGVYLPFSWIAGGLKADDVPD